jgi:UDP-N-acetylglucosamine--N-acetylmuramyl-(pentapeptide) pyrophosphoryl-undecaprenol N-acetylglucosamine transferase
MRLPKVALAGGGTAGHVFPALATKEALEQQGVTDFVLVSDTRASEKGYLAPFGPLPAFLMAPSGLSYRPSLKGVANGLRLFWGAVGCWRFLKREKVSVVFATGAYVGAAAGLAAGWLGLPLVLYEGDASPGRANRRLARRAKALAVAFEAAGAAFPKGKWVVTGPPVRLLETPASRQAARAVLGLKPELPTLALFGGSQGAAVLNDFAIKYLLPAADEGRLQILHQCGADNLEALTQRLEGRPLPAGYLLTGFTNEVGTWQKAADLVLSRAGSSTIGEYCLLGTASVLVPLEAGAGGHQRYNAQALAETGAARIAGEELVRSGALMALLEELLAAPEELDYMRRKALALARPEAAADIARLVLQAAQGNEGSSPIDK